MHVTKPLTALCLLVLVGGLAACQSGGGEDLLPPTGGVAPTVAGESPAHYPNLGEARRAFTRQDKEGMFTAVLQDAAWLRFLGTPDEVEADHRAYFDQGYTTFDVTLSVDAFTKPTAETFVLEDSAGRRVVGKPVTYKSQMGTQSGRFNFQFELAFQHAINRDTQWVRLVRQADGASLEWSFD